MSSEGYVGLMLAWLCTLARDGLERKGRSTSWDLVIEWHNGIFFRSEVKEAPPPPSSTL